MSKKLSVCLAIAAFLSCASLADASLENRPSSARSQAPAKQMALTLVFSGKVKLEASAVKISDAKGDTIRTGDLRYGLDPRNVEIPLASALRPGIYSISWHAVSLDCQESVGGYDFTIDAVGQQVPAVAQQ